jgi:hypothetical protein
MALEGDFFGLFLWKSALDEQITKSARAFTVVAPTKPLKPR